MDYFLSGFIPLAAVLGIATAVATVLIVPFQLHHRSKDRARLYETLKQAQESDHPFAPDVIQQIVGGPPLSRTRDIRRGAILLAIAVGIAIPTLIFFLLLSNFSGERAYEVIHREFVGLFLVGISVLFVIISVLACMGGTLLVLGLTLKRPGEEAPGRVSDKT